LDLEPLYRPFCLPDLLQRGKNLLLIDIFKIIFQRNITNQNFKEGRLIIIFITSINHINFRSSPGHL
jgi:hypothetical protein